MRLRPQNKRAVSRPGLAEAVVPKGVLMGKLRIVSFAVVAVGLVVSLSAWWFLNSTATLDAYTAVSTACDKADTVQDYDLVTYLSGVSGGVQREGRIELRVSGDDYVGAGYDENGLVSDVLYRDGVFYFRPPGGTWEQSDFNPLGTLDHYPYNSGTLCPGIDNLTELSAGQLDGVVVRHFGADIDGGRAAGSGVGNARTFSIDSQGWLVQYEAVTDGTAAFGGPLPLRARTVYSGMNDPNVIPQAK